MNEYLDVVGDDDEVGAILNRIATTAAPAKKVVNLSALRGKLLPQAAQQALPVARPGWMGPQGIPQGIALPQEELDTLPFNTITLTNASPTGYLEAYPQRPFRGERLVMFATLVPAGGGTPADAGHFTVIDPAIFVGAVQVGASQGRTPLSVFAATAFGVRLSFPHSGQGTRIYIPITSLAPIAVGDSITVGGTVIGRSVRLSGIGIW